MFEDMFEDMKKMQKQMDNMFKDLSKGMNLKKAATDISEKKDSIIVKVDIPGVEKEDIDLAVTEDTIRIKAKKKKEKAEEKEGYYSRERSYRDYNVLRTLPAKVKPETADAEYENGVLKVKIKKSEKEKKKKSKKIEVK